MLGRSPLHSAVKTSSGDQVLVHSCSCTIHGLRREKMSGAHNFMGSRVAYDPRCVSSCLSAPVIFIGCHSCLEPVQQCINGKTVHLLDRGNKAASVSNCT